MSSSTVIGIDLGTVNSCVAAIIDGKPKVLSDTEGRNTVPSVFAISANQEPIVGHDAVKQQDANRKNTIFAVKRLIGRKYKSEDIVTAAGKLPYKIIPAQNGDAWVEINGQPTSPEEVSARILVKMREIAEQALGERVNRVVITVPAHFNDAERQATKDAGKIAGLEVLRLINEPTAAALAYGLDLVDSSGPVINPERGKVIAVFDLGGGTFDISILSLKEGVFSVLSTNGDTYLGGEDFDLAIVSHMLEEFKKSSGLQVVDDKAALQRIKAAARDAKHQLSDKPVAEVSIPFLARGKEHLTLSLDRKTLERLVDPILKRLEEPCFAALEDAGLEANEVDDIILVGGMTRMPAVKKWCARIFQRPPLDTVNPDEAVALGAAIQAGLLEGFVKGVSLLDVTSLSLGIEIQGGMVHPIIPRNTKVPTSVTEIFTTSAPNQPQVSIHVVQGESNFAPDNKSLGRFELTGLKPAPRGEPDIAVTFSIDAEGMVSVSAKNVETGIEQKLEIVASSGLNDDDIDRLLHEQRMAEEQKARIEKRQAEIALGATSADRQEIERLQGELKMLVFMTQSKLNTNGKGYKGRHRASLEEALNRGRSLMEGNPEREALLVTLEEVQKGTELLDQYIEEMI
jgi:molecular chaperone DnaK